MAAGRVDPVGGWNFTVSLLGSTTTAGAVLSALAKPFAAGFSECSGLEASMTVEDYREGGRNDTVLRFPGRISWSPIRLRRGMASSEEIWNWYDAFLQGRGERLDGVITLLDEHGEPVRIWRFDRGIPSRWAGPAMNAGQSGVAIEELEIVHEGIRPEATGAVSRVAGAITSLAGSLGA
jgi:phage tail-like protein